MTSHLSAIGRLGTGFTVDENGVISASGGGSSAILVQRSLEGDVYETTLMYWRAPAACTIQSVSMSLSSNPSAAGSYCKVQVMKNGLLETDSIFTSDTPMQVTENTTASNGIYTASGTLDTGNDMDDLAEGDVVHFRVNQADTGSADLLIQMVVSSAASGGGLTWTEVTGTTQSASADNGYITNNESLVTITLPSTCAVGKTIRIIGKGAGGWKLAQNSGQSIRIGTDETTEGTSGYIESGSPYDSIEVVCVTEDTEFTVMQMTGVLGVV